MHDTFYPDRIVVGSDSPEASALLHELYRPLLEQTFEPPEDTPRPERYPLPPLIKTTATSAELTKYAANSFLATKISFINEFSRLAEKVGADITEVARAIGLDQRIGPRFLQAGIGWGGSCFGKDTRAILATAAAYDHNLPIVLVTDWAEYRHLPLAALKTAARGDLLLDARNLLNPEEVSRHGFTYLGIGRQTRFKTSLTRSARPRSTPERAAGTRRTLPDLGSRGATCG